MQHINMKLLLLIVGVFVFNCSATTSVSDNLLKRIQREVEELKRSNEDSIAALKKIYDEKISTLEQQLQMKVDQKSANIIPKTVKQNFKL